MLGFFRYGCSYLLLTRNTKTAIKEIGIIYNKHMRDYFNLPPKCSSYRMRETLGIPSV